jgi:hypothetical protein
MTKLAGNAVAHMGTAFPTDTRALCYRRGARHPERVIDQWPHPLPWFTAP